MLGSMMKTLTAVLAVAAMTACAAHADTLDGARAKLNDIRAARAARDAGPAPAAAPAAAHGEPAAKGPPAPTVPYKKVDMRVSLGPGRPQLKTSGTFPYLGNPFGKQAYRVIIEEHAYQVGDRIRGAKILKITADELTLTKDGDTWTIPASMH